MGAGGVAAAEVAFNHQVVVLIHKRASERTGRHTSLTPHAYFLVDFHRAGFRVAGDSVHQAGFSAGRVLALQTNHRYEQILETAVERVNAA